MQNPFTAIEGLSEKEKALGYLVAQLVFAPESDSRQLANQVSCAGMSAQMVDIIGKRLTQYSRELNCRQPTMSTRLPFSKTWRCTDALSGFPLRVFALTTNGQRTFTVGL